MEIFEQGLFIYAQYLVKIIIMEYLIKWWGDQMVRIGLTWKSELLNSFIFQRKVCLQNCPLAGSVDIKSEFLEYYV